MAKRLSLSEEDFMDPEEIHQETISKENVTEKVQVVKKEVPVSTKIVNEVKKDTTNEEQKPEIREEKAPARKGRKPNEVPTERDFISINIGGGIREGIEILCNRESLRSGRKVSYNEYITKILKNHIEENRAYIETLKNAAMM